MLLGVIATTAKWGFLQGQTRFGCPTSQINMKIFGAVK